MSPDVSFLHAISGLFDYIFLTLWVGWLLIMGTHPTGVTFFGIIYSNIWMTPFSDEDFLTLETSDTCALWITWWFTLSFGCPHTVLGRCSWPHHPTITYRLSFMSPDVSFLHAVCGLVNYIFLTLYLGGWVGGLLMAGTPQGLLSPASYTVTFKWLPSVMKIFQPWKHVTRMHCESRCDSLFLSVAHIRSWEDVVDHTTQLLCTICLLHHLMSLSYMPSVVCSIISSWHCMWVGEWAGYLWQAPKRGYFLWHHISNIWMTPFSDEDFPTLETSDTYALWITWWFTLSFGCSHTVLGRCSWPTHPTITYHLSIKSPDVSFLHAISGLVNYIFLTLCGWVSGWVTYGRHPTGVTSTPPNYYMPSVFYVTWCLFLTCHQWSVRLYLPDTVGGLVTYYGHPPHRGYFLWHHIQ